MLRPFTIYGPGPLRGEAGHLVGRWLELAQAGEALTVHGDGTQTVDLVPSSVLGACCVRFFTEPDPPALRVLNGPAVSPPTIAALAELFRQRFPSVTVRSIPAPPDATPSARVWGDRRALEAFLGESLPSSPASLEAFLASR